MRKVTFRERLRYAFDNTMAKGTKALVGWLALVTALLILVFTLIVLFAGIGPPGSNGHRPGFFLQLWYTLQHAIDPAAIEGDPTTRWILPAVMLIVGVAGLFIVSALIGVIATGLDNKLEDLRKGRSFVVEKGHTLILNWSTAVFTIVNELAISNESERKPVIVLLADRAGAARRST